MATTNQRNRSGGQRGQAGGQSSGKSATSALQNVTSQAGQKLSDMRDEASDYISQGTERFGQMTRGHESQAVLVALAAGFGIGFVIGCALVSGNQRPKTWNERMMAEGIGRKVMDRLEHMLPDAITERFAR